MKQWLTLFEKEVLEMWRNFRWIWMPITFILLGVQEPLISYYMEDILNTVGGLPEGAEISIPVPSAPEVLIASMSQYNTLGILIIVLVSMSLISGERKSGTAAMILVKPVSHASFITAKWAGTLLLVWVSLLIGFIASWYYTGLLFDWVDLKNFLGAFFLEGLWLTFVVTVAVLFSSLFFVSGAAGFAALGSVIILTLVTGTLSHVLEWSPAKLPDYAGEFVLAGKFPEHSGMAIILSLIVIAILLVTSIYVFRRKELAA
ncbi:ABC transporter permease [Bacillus sp. FJAT-27225]|uniref:ABC transporter permease n=1 Tax=Bacillus sp. FJAT-27225 TaxID=1743144 RepID=UPI00080C3007|nr:ABC transporter permease subunit [Bacillus sp. FJAT-27225]OCA81561.1 ABC transporter permease [Bacillus sp. FJAT-27225]